MKQTKRALQASIAAGLFVAVLTIVTPMSGFILGWVPAFSSVRDLIMNLTLPGMLGAIAFSSDVHAFNLLAAAINFLVYYVIASLAFYSFQRFKGSRE